MRFSSIWLWQNETDHDYAVISWCSEKQYGTIKNNTFFPVECLASHNTKKLRDKKSSLALNDLVGDSLGKLFSTELQRLDDDEYLRIHLINTLPADWQKLPLEWCQWQGELLYKKIQVIRYANFPKQTLPIHTQKQFVILNLWPQSNNHRQFFENMIYDQDSKVLQGGIKSTLYASNHDLSDLSLLCIIAHGNENHPEQPFLCERQQAWRLPYKQLPPLILLIACGSEQGDLLAYGKKLLQQGARTILAAQGKLDAAQMTVFLEAFIQHWKTGLSAGHILYQLQQEAPSQTTARRIYVLGQANLCHLKKTKQSINISNWSALTTAAIDNDSALQRLLDQLTLHNLIKHSRLTSSINDLYRALELDYNDPHEKKSLLYDRLTVLYPHCLPLTQKWLSYFLLYLSSIHEHQHSDKYHQEIIRLQKIHIHGSELFLFYIAYGCYRAREYERSTRILIDAVHSISLNSQATQIDTNNQEATYRLFGLAVNISTAVLLPELGLFFLDHANDCLLLSSLSEEHYANESFIQLDREARLYVALGDMDNERKGEAGLIQALQKLEKKRLLAINARAQTGERELCLLLYLSAWLKNETPKKSYVTEAMLILQPVTAICQEISAKKANMNKLYLLKALATWAWLQQDTEASGLLQKYLPTLISLCKSDTTHDSSLLGAIIAYMSLMGNTAAKQQWFYMANKMLNAKCYFEVAILHSLLKEENKAQIAFKKFKQQQYRVLKHLQKLNKGIPTTEYKELLDRINTRLKKEEKHAIENIKLFSANGNTLQYRGFIPF